MVEYMYCEAWNNGTGLPSTDVGWLTGEEAAERFESGDSLNVVRVKSHYVDEDGVDAVLGEWVISFGSGRLSRYVRVEWLSPAQSVWRLNDYQNIGGRLFRAVSVDYAFPDDDRRYDFSEWTAMEELILNPDGTGVARAEVGRKGQQAEVKDFPVERMWIDFPKFGEWEALADPSFGRFADGE